MKKKLMGITCAILTLCCSTAFAASVSVTKNEFSAADAPENSTLIAALYDNSNRMKDIISVNTSGNVTKEFDEDFKAQMNADDAVKVFLWNSKTLSPLCNSKSYIVSELPDSINPEENTLTLSANGYTFKMKLEDNATAESFKKLMPLSLNMSELNGNEKYNYLSGVLPANSYRPGTIYAGDVMLYGSNCVVIFYKTFSSSYSYTKIGHIEDISNLTAALGKGNVTVEYQ